MEVSLWTQHHHRSSVGLQDFLTSPLWDSHGALRFWSFLASLRLWFCSCNLHDAMMTWYDLLKEKKLTSIPNYTSRDVTSLIPWTASLQQLLPHEQHQEQADQPCYRPWASLCILQMENQPQFSWCDATKYCSAREEPAILWHSLWFSILNAEPPLP